MNDMPRCFAVVRVTTGSPRGLVLVNVLTVKTISVYEIPPKVETNISVPVCERPSVIFLTQKKYKFVSPPPRTRRLRLPIT